MSVLDSPRPGLAARVRGLSKGRSGSAATLQTLLTNTLIQALNVITGIVTARILGPTGRGETAAMVMWPFILAQILTLGLPSALLYNLKRHPEEARSLFSAALWMGTLLGCLAAVGGILFVPSHLTQYSPQIVRQAQWLMLITPTTLMAMILVTALQACDDFAAFNWVRFLTPVLSLVGLIVLLPLHAVTSFTTALVYSLAGTPAFLWMLGHLLRKYRPRLVGWGLSTRKLLHYGLRSYGIDLLNTLAFYLDQALVVGMLAPKMMGMYTVALSLSRILNVVQTAVVSVLFPKASGRPPAEVIALTGRMARVSGALTALAGLIVIAAGPLLLRVLYGKDYLEAVTVARILTVEVTLSSTVWVLGQAFMALGRPGTVTLLQAVGVGLSFPLMLVLIPRYGLTGAGIAILGSTMARLLFILLNFPLTLKVRPPGFLLTRADLDWVRHSLRHR